jgi:CubicO group peptidase (beta-lactamase class C family)
MMSTLTIGKTASLALLVALFASTAEAQLSPKFDEKANALRHQWDIPGVTMSVVHAGQILFLGGFGMTGVEGGRPVDGRTLVSVASVTKPLNAVAIGMLVDQGRLGWDDPVKKHIPEFEFGDPFVSGQVTIRDLVTHRSGLPGVLGPISGADDYTIGDLLDALPTSAPLIPLRHRLEYSQVGIALTGEIVRRVTGMPWTDFVQGAILGPLGMQSSYLAGPLFIASHGDPGAVPNLMGRAVRRGGHVVDGEWLGVTSLYAPAAGLVTTAEDMTSFMIFLLASGIAGGQQLLSAERIQELYSPHMVESTQWSHVTNPLARFVAYGLGWYVHEYEGRLVVEHGGATAGSSVLALLPELELGVFISTGASYPPDSNRFVSALKFTVIDELLALPTKDWAGLHSVARRPQ